jgi:hypothetical protein
MHRQILLFLHVRLILLLLISSFDYTDIYTVFFEIISVGVS